MIYFKRSGVHIMENNKEKIFSNINENQKLKKKSKLGTITQKSNYLETDFDIAEFLNFKKFVGYCLYLHFKCYPLSRSPLQNLHKPPLPRPLPL